MILLSDANVLIDLGYVDGLSVLTQLGTVEVLDVVFDECCHPRQPDLPEAIAAADIQTVKVTQEWARSAHSYQTGPLSFQDALCLYYAKTYQRLLLTNEKPLRRCCQEQQVSVHGTLWIVQSIYERQLLDAKILCGWLSTLNRHNRRLPTQEVAILRKLLDC
ncbi:MAG: hypothetical protein IGR92_03770 [Leptolyngbyaceae cyanobacterium T60_A2020_046]|nr:hypothetical protein [Leptolyngbyaceae cyanobacterium T60_A2020_046]